MSRNILIEKVFQEPLAIYKLRRLGIPTDSDTIKAIDEFPFKITKEIKLCVFQFKIIISLHTDTGYILLIAKWHVYVRKLDNPPPCYNVYMFTGSAVTGYLEFVWAA